MDKEYIDLDSLLEFNHYTRKDFGDKKFLRGKCPECPPEKLGALSIHRSMRWARCFRCDKIFIAKGLHIDEIKNELAEEQETTVSASGIVKLANPMIQKLYKPVPKEGIEYLRNRNPLVDDWTRYKLGYDETSIFIPYYYMGELIFYQIRYMKGARRYNMPSIPSPIYIAREWDYTKPTIISEGPFDVIANDNAVGDEFNIVGLVGKSLSQYKLQLLENLSTPQYYIMLDETELSEKIQSKLYGSRIIPTFGPDPEELEVQMGLEEYRKYIKENT